MKYRKYDNVFARVVFIKLELNNKRYISYIHRMYKYMLVHK